MLTIEQTLRTLAAVDSAPEIALQLDTSIYLVTAVRGLIEEPQKAYSIALQPGTTSVILIRPTDPLGARLSVGLALSDLLRVAASNHETL
jgi:hypothetical protein